MNKIKLVATYLSISDQRHQEEVFFSSLVPFSYSFSTIFCPQLSFSSSTFSYSLPCLPTPLSYALLFHPVSHLLPLPSLLSPSSLLPLCLPPYLLQCPGLHSCVFRVWKIVSSSACPSVYILFI
jgi:hypothetical protein